MRRGYGVDGGRDGVVIGNLLASFSHLRDTSRHHWARRFVAFVRQTRERRDAKPTAGRLVADPGLRAAKPRAGAPSRLRLGGVNSGAPRELAGRDQGTDGDSSSLSARQGQAGGRRRRRLRGGAKSRNARARRRAGHRVRGAARRRVPTPCATRRSSSTSRANRRAPMSTGSSCATSRPARTAADERASAGDTRRARADQRRRPPGPVRLHRAVPRRPRPARHRDFHRRRFADARPHAQGAPGKRDPRRLWTARGLHGQVARAASARACTTARARRRFWERVLEGPIAEMVLANNEPAAEAALAREIEREAGAARPRRAARSISSAPGRAIRTSSPSARCA